jgi:hypothetical protein
MLCLWLSTKKRTFLETFKACPIVFRWLSFGHPMVVREKMSGSEKELPSRREGTALLSSDSSNPLNTSPNQIYLATHCTVVERFLLQLLLFSEA